MECDYSWPHRLALRRRGRGRRAARARGRERASDDVTDDVFRHHLVRGREQDANRERMQRERMKRRLEEAERRKPIGSNIVALRQFESSSSKKKIHELFLRIFFQNILIC